MSVEAERGYYPSTIGFSASRTKEMECVWPSRDTHGYRDNTGSDGLFDLDSVSTHSAELRVEISRTIPSPRILDPTVDVFPDRQVTCG
jgi:hypothetical protein